MCTCDNCEGSEISSTVGPKGDRGATGATGPQGAAGADGANGTSTSTTSDGTTGTTVLGASSTGSTHYFDVATGNDVTLPTAPPDGTYYNFVVQTSVTSNDYSVSTGTGDYITGSLFAGKAASDDSLFLANAANTDTHVTMNGSTTGGLIGTAFKMTYKSATHLWFITGKTYGSAVLATSLS